MMQKRARSSPTRSARTRSRICRRRSSTSASLGQVYVGHVMQDDEKIKVAVKVQRPGVAETIALDLHLLRIGAGPLKALFQANTDLVGLVDTWGVRFVDELDYVREAGHAVDFSRAIAETPLCGRGLRAGAPGAPHVAKGADDDLGRGPALRLCGRRHGRR